MLDQVYDSRVIDEADFNSVMARRIFKHQSTALAWARTEQLAAQSRLRGSGETDAAFIDAIIIQVRPVDFDAA